MLDLLHDVSLLLATPVDQTPVGGGDKTPAPGWFQTISSFGLIIPILLIFLFLVWLPQRKRDREIKEQLGAMAKGDKVRSIGGIIGTVMSVDGDEVVVKVDESSNTKLRFAKAAIASVTKKNAKDDDKPADKA